MVTIKGTLTGGPVDPTGMMHILDLWMKNEISEREAQNILGVEKHDMNQFYKMYQMGYPSLISIDEMAQIIWDAWKAGW